VALQVLDNPYQAQYLSRRGIARLLFLEAQVKVKYLQKELLKGQELALSVAGIGTRDQVVDDLILAAWRQLCLSEEQPLPQVRAEFDQLLLRGNSRLIEVAQALASDLNASLKLLVDVRKQLKQHKNALALAFTLSDIQTQLQQLFYPGLVYQTPSEWLAQYPRYLRAIQFQLEKALLNPQKDRQLLADAQSLWQRFADFLAKEGDYQIELNPPLRDYLWW